MPRQLETFATGDGAAKKKKTLYKDIERRREQNRVNAQKSYYRKLNILDTLRAEVTALESSYKIQMRMLKGGASAPPPHTESRPSEHSSELAPRDDFHRHQEDQVARGGDYRWQLQKLVTAHDELKDEHRMLKELHELHVKFQCRAQLLVDSERLTYDDMFGIRSEKWRAEVLAELRARCPARMKRPLSVDECYGIGREVYAKIMTFTKSENYASTGGAVCGWADRRRVEDDLLKFSLQKMFYNHTTHEIAARTWPVLASPAKLQSFYSASMKMHCEVAQKVDENNVVIYQEYEAKERDPITNEETSATVLVRSLLLITLFQIEDGYVMLFYGIDPSRLQERDEAEALASVGISDRKVWLDKFSWCIWQEAGPAAEHCNGAFVGAVPAQGASSRYWSVEVLLLSLRWEHEVIGPNFILHNDDDPEPQALENERGSISSLLVDDCETGAEGGAGGPLFYHEQQQQQQQQQQLSSNSQVHFGSWSPVGMPQMC